MPLIFCFPRCFACVIVVLCLLVFRVRWFIHRHKKRGTYVVTISYTHCAVNAFFTSYFITKYFLGVQLSS